MPVLKSALFGPLSLAASAVLASAGGAAIVAVALPLGDLWVDDGWIAPIRQERPALDASSAPVELSLARTPPRTAAAPQNPDDDEALDVERMLIALGWSDLRYAVAEIEQPEDDWRPADDWPFVPGAPGGFGRNLTGGDPVGRAAVAAPLAAASSAVAFAGGGAGAAGAGGGRGAGGSAGGGASPFADPLVAFDPLAAATTGAITSVPLPAALPMALAGLFALGFLGRRRA